MKMMKKLLAALLALCLMCLPALGEEATQSPDDVLATVNGDVVTRAEFEAYLLDLQTYYSQYGYDVASPEMDGLLRQFAMETAVEYKLIDQKIEELGLTLTAEEEADAAATARADWEALLNDGLAYYGVTTETDEATRAAMLVQILAELESMGYTEALYIEQAKQSALYTKLEDMLLQDVTVTDEDVRAHFATLVEADRVAYENDAGAYENVQYMNQVYLMYGMADYYTEVYYKPNGYRAVTHILLAVDDTLLQAYSDLQATYEEQQNALEEGTEVTGTIVTAEEVEAARLAVLASAQTQIDEINAQLAAGATFNSLIPQYSQDPGMMDEASIAAGYEVHMDSIMWDPVFTAAAFSVDQPGEVSEPVVGMYGVHLVHYDHDVAGGPVELTTDMLEAMRSDLLAAARSEAFYGQIDAWQAEATIEYAAEAADYVLVTE